MKMFEWARDAGLPVTWWKKAIDEGDSREWRELKAFADHVRRDMVQQLREADQHAAADLIDKQLNENA